jgi:hypothetical protein
MKFSTFIIHILFNSAIFRALSFLHNPHKLVKMKPESLALSTQRKSLKTSIKSGFADLSLVEQALVVNLGGNLLLQLKSQKFLTSQGLLHATALGIGLWSFLGPQGWAVCVTYLILGNIVTKIKLLEKQVCLALNITYFIVLLHQLYCSEKE